MMIVVVVVVVVAAVALSRCSGLVAIWGVMKIYFLVRNSTSKLLTF